MTQLPPRLVFSALRGSAGKTTVSLGVAAAWRAQGLEVAPFKKGPDYIDPAWLSRAAGHPCRNLDTFLVDSRLVRAWFAAKARPDQVAVIEGARGLFDGVDVVGTHSTAELTKLLCAPAVVVLDCTKVSRTAAAMVLGCQQLDSATDIRGIILNRVARSRHENIVRESIESVCGIPVLGAIPKLKRSRNRERHLGLVPPQEHPDCDAVIAEAREVAEQYLDLDGLLTVARGAQTTEVEECPGRTAVEEGFAGLRVAVPRDSVFQFYYPENLEALADLGAQVIDLNALSDSELPEVDAMYLGGGFPETQAEALSANESLRASLLAGVEDGLPVLAECGGLMYLGKELRLGGGAIPMVGALPVAFELRERPQGHGYAVVEASSPNPYFDVGDRLTGHEFHYSRPCALDETNATFAFSVQRGTGFDGQRDGLVYKNVLATYTHFHALGVTDWAPALLRRAAKYHEGHAVTPLV